MLEERRAAGDEALRLAFQLAVMLKEQGKLGEARPMLEHVLAGFERTLGVEDEHTLATMGNLVLVLMQQGDLVAAREMYERTLEGRERLLGAAHPHTQWTKDRLAEFG